MKQESRHRSESRLPALDHARLSDARRGWTRYTQEMLDAVNNKQDPKEGINAAAGKVLPVLEQLEGKLADTGLKGDIGELVE